MKLLKRIYFVFLLIVINSLILCCSSCENNTWKYNHNTIINYPTYSYDELESISNDIKSYSSNKITYQNTILDIEGEITTFRNAFSNTLALNENKNLISLINGTIICEKLDEGLVIDDESKYSLMIQDNFVYSKRVPIFLYRVNSDNEETNDTIYIIDCYGNCLDQFQTKDEIIVNYPSQVIVTPTLYPSSIVYFTSSYQSASIELKDSKTQELVKTLNYSYRLDTDGYKVYKASDIKEETEELNKLYEKEAYQDENGTIIAYTTVQDGLLTLYDENNRIKNRFNLKNNYFYGSKKLVFSDKIIYYYSTLVSEKAQLVEHENPDTGFTEKQTEYVLDFDNSDYTSILIVNLKDYTITYNGNFDYYISNAKKCGENYLVSFYSLGEDGLFEQTKKQVIMKDDFIFENMKEEIINNVIKLDDNHLVVEMNEDQDQYYLVSKENRVLINSDNTSSSIEILDANTLLIHYQNKMFEVDIKKLIEASGDYEFALGYTYISKEIYGEERLHIYNLDSSYFIGQNKTEEKYLDYLKQNIIVSKDKVIIGGEIVYQVSTFDSISSFDKIYGLGNHFVYKISTVNGEIKYVYVIKSESVLE